MNIYLVERTDKVGWDQFESIVAMADSEEEAISLFPEPWPTKVEYTFKVTLVGYTAESYTDSNFIILASFNAG